MLLHFRLSLRTTSLEARVCVYRYGMAHRPERAKKDATPWTVVDAATIRSSAMLAVAPLNKDIRHEAEDQWPSGKI